MKAETFLTVTSIVFTTIAIFHLVRVLFGLELIINGWAVPLWVNTLAFLVAGLLAFFGIRLKKRK